MLLFFFLVTLLGATTAQAGGFDYPVITNQIHLLRPKLGAGGSFIDGVSCLSWRFGVETNNIIDWKTVPEECEDYVGNYMLGDQYRNDSQVVTREAFRYAKSLNLTNDGKNVWVFDIDETTLSNLPYYAKHGFGAEPYNETSYDEWVAEEKAPALPESLKLYKKLRSFGIKIVFLTGRKENTRTATENNLKSVGYQTWEQLILKPSEYSGTSVEYKSGERKKLEEEGGYRIVGNMGDQWSDLLGTNPGIRTFKLPDPMYYIS
ncbi:hypothetical protein TIFTF001_006543 [Ficus carica]|uniref:Acid phosphatase n=1 Tax=Ficus carica TaxID=3494 RepID=A0AA87ZRG2_FICCA|nr:hypothetical protein TIFTF001_006543 [Ficus carica]